MKSDSQNDHDGDEPLLAQVLDEYLTALEEGAPLDVEAIASRHPQIAGDVRCFAESLDFLHRSTRPRVTPSGPTGTLEASGKRRLGDFLIGAEIGRGGMGIVYEAHQLSLGRRVALKVLPFAAVWDQKQIARFRNEAQAAAQLQHGNIVPVFAVGEERGVHFYAMQLIEGQSLDVLMRELKVRAACRESAPGLGSTVSGGQDATPGVLVSDDEDRVDAPPEPAWPYRRVAEIGIQAAAALHHAHETGIVHRDVKPSNLLIDRYGKLWVTDFGLARIQQSPGVTVTGDVVGTLRYMSPEQAAGRHAEVDLRSDVYGLGATLYELLTGRPPFQGEDHGEIRKAIETQEPIHPRSLNKAIPLDLETIVLHSLAKNRDERYPTAQSLADDLRRFLDGRPTMARRASLLDRGVKVVRRHRRLAAGSVALLTAIAMASTVGVVRLARETAEKETALAESRRNLQRAEANLQKAREVVDRFGIGLADDLQSVPGTEPLRQTLLSDTLSYYGDFIKQAGQAAIPAEQIVDARLKTGAVHAKLGAIEQAADEYRAAASLLDGLLAGHPDDPALRLRRGLVANDLALVLAAGGDQEGALRESAASIERLQGLLNEKPDDEELTTRLAELQINRGTLLGRSGAPTETTKEAIGSLRTAIGLLQELRLRMQEARHVVHLLAIAYNSLSVVENRADTTSSLDSARRAVELLQQICDDKMPADEWLADWALAICNLAALQGDAGRTDEAIETLGKAIALRESLLRKAPWLVRLKTELGVSLNTLGMLQIRREDAAEAEDAFRRANQLYRELVNDFPDQIPYAAGWAALLNNQGLALAESGHLESAATAYEQAIALQRQVVDLLPASDDARDALSRMFFNLRQVLLSREKWQDAARVTHARRLLWQGDGERLVGVAAEFLTLHDAAPAAWGESIRTQVVETLLEALNAGYRPTTPLRADERFAPVADWPEADALPEAWGALIGTGGRSTR